jgi:uncharacterized protein YraI
MSDENLNQQEEQPEEKNTGKIIGTILLVLVGVVLVLVVGVFLGRALTPEAEATSPPEAGPTAVPPTVAVPTAAPEVPYAVVGDEAVNIRSGPSTDYPVYGVAQPGQSAEIIGKSADSGWWAIKISTDYSPDGQAWVSATYTTAYNAENVPVLEAPPLPPGVNPPAPPSEGVTVITTEPINVRAGPQSSYPSYGMVPAGTPLNAVGFSPDTGWIAVTVPTSVAPDGIGWVSGAYAEPADLSGLPQMEAP